jgi:S1-C subfamily serine protease
MSRKITFLVLCLTIVNQIFSQKVKQYLDKEESIVDAESAFSVREFSGTATKPTGKVTWIFVSNEKPYFEGNITSIDATDPSLNKYKGVCKWYYKNGNLKSERTFLDNGSEDGVSKYYYENGKIKSKYYFEKGKQDNTKIEDYDENGNKNLLFTESFNSNSNDWDLYNSNLSYSKIVSGKLELESYTKAGTSRYISLPLKGDEWSYEMEFTYPENKIKAMHGILFNFKDWENHGFFLINGETFTIGFIVEGLKVMEASSVFSSSINNKKNNLKIVSKNSKTYFSINGEVEYNIVASNLKSSNFGPIVMGKAKVMCDNIVFKEFNSESSGAGSSNTGNWKGSGSGVIFSTDGYILTNYHVVDDAKNIIVDIKRDGEVKSYKATVKTKDKDNDLAILKIEDESFKNYSSIDYSIKDGGMDVGASVFTLGYPLALSGMGTEVKFTDGKISSKTGYNNAINSYQTSVPLQPGNSGGPLFNANGQLVGVVNAVVNSTDNVSYAIKINYFKNLIDLLPTTVVLPNTEMTANTAVEEKIKKLSPYVVYVKYK